MKRFIKEMIFIIVGCFITASGLVMFTIPNNIAPGGSSGLATSLAVIIPLSVGILTWIVNVPILIGSWVILGKNVTVKTLIASTVLTGFMEGLDLIFPKFTENPLMAAVLGGILIGIGIGVLFLKGFSMGGTDLLSIMIGKYLPNISVGYILMLCDGIVVIIAAIVFKDLEVFLYSIITVAVASKAIDFFMEGMNHARVIFIITNKGQEIANKLNAITQNGCTLMSGTGTYSGEGKDVLMAVVHPNTTAETLSAAREIDPSLFAFIASAAEVHGKGFKYYNANANSTKVIPQ